MLRPGCSVAILDFNNAADNPVVDATQASRAGAPRRHCWQQAGQAGGGHYGYLFIVPAGAALAAARPAVCRHTLATCHPAGLLFGEPCGANSALHGSSRGVRVSAPQLASTVLHSELAALHAARQNGT